MNKKITWSSRLEELACMQSVPYSIILFNDPILLKYKMEAEKKLQGPLRTQKYNWEALPMQCSNNLTKKVLLWRHNGG